jgi:hypothetical protein
MYLSLARSPRSDGVWGKKVAAIKMEIALPAIPSSNLDQN